MDVYSSLFTRCCLSLVLLPQMVRADCASVVANFINFSRRKIQMNIPDEIVSLLKVMYETSQSCDWSESDAQETMVWGSSLYEKFVLNDPSYSAKH